MLGIEYYVMDEDPPAEADAVPPTGCLAGCIVWLALVLALVTFGC
jgi:hypothetical protein